MGSANALLDSRTQSGFLAEVFVGDFEVSAARRVGLDELTVGGNNRDQNDHDGRRDPRGETQKAEASQRQNHEQFLRPVGDRGERVARKNGKGQVLRKQLAFKLL